MPYQTRQTKKDVNGNPIPQEFDPVKDDFIPLTVKEFYGNSTETKPMNVDKGSTYYEFDTGNAYIFTGVSWVVL
jgi:hypothetical protein